MMDSAKTFEDFKEILKSYEIKTFSKFNVYKSPKGFLDEKREISSSLKLYWKDGLPYYHLGSRVYTCHQGKDKNLGKKQKYMEKKLEEAKNDHIFQKIYNLTQPSKKMDCPASITVTRVYTLPQYKQENPTKSMKMTISEKIKKKLRNNEDVEGEEAFWFVLPSADAHKNHVQGEIAAIKEPVDPLVRSKIKELVHEGETDASVISELLDKYVTTELQQNDRKRRRFFPDIHTIRGIMTEGRRDIRRSNGVISDPGKVTVVNKELSKRGSKQRKVITEPVDRLVRSKIKELVREGETDASVISELLDIFVTTDLQQNDRNRKCFFPDIRTIKRIIRECKRSIRRSKIDHDVISENNHDCTEEITVVCKELEERDSKRRKLINECNSYLENLSSVLCMLPESELFDLGQKLMNLSEEMQSKINIDNSTGLFIEIA